MSGKLDRGFESHPLRHNYLSQSLSTVSIRATQCYMLLYDEPVRVKLSDDYVHAISAFHQLTAV